MNRIVNEIHYFNQMDVSVCWLKPSIRQLRNVKKFKESLKEGNARVTYHTCCYSSSHFESKKVIDYYAFKIE